MLFPLPLAPSKRGDARRRFNATLSVNPCFFF
jgi:hypothetical protein